jgi:hypothetical protein
VPRQSKTGLFQIQADHLSDFRQARQANPTSRAVVYALFGRAESIELGGVSHCITDGTEAASRSGPESAEPVVDRPIELARCFLRLANVPNFALDRLSRYEATLWRQVGQILVALNALDRCKPQERRRQYLVDGQRELPV